MIDLQGVHRLRADLGGRVSGLSKRQLLRLSHTVGLKAYPLLCAAELYLTEAETQVGFSDSELETLAVSFLDKLPAELGLGDDVGTVQAIYTQLTNGELGLETVVGAASYLYLTLFDPIGQYQELRSSLLAAYEKVSPILGFDTSINAKWNIFEAQKECSTALCDGVSLIQKWFSSPGSSAVALETKLRNTQYRATMIADLEGRKLKELMCQSVRKIFRTKVV